MSFAMQEPEPLRLNHTYPPLAPRSSQLPRLEAKQQGGGRRPAHDREGRKRIALNPGKAQDVAASLGLSVSYVFTCRREFQAERDAAGLSGGKAAYEAADRLRIALTDGTLREIARRFNISTATLWTYRREFLKERIAAGLEKESTDATGSTASGASEVADRGTRNGEPLAGVETGQGKEIEAHLL